MVKGLLDRPADSPTPPPPGGGRADGNPDSNARGQYLAFVAPPAGTALAERIAQAEAEIAAAEAEAAAAETILATDAAVESTTGEFDWVPIVGWGAAAIAVGAAGYGFYKLHQAQEAKAKAQAELKQLEEEQAKANTETNVKVKGAPCLVGEYKDLTKICGGEAHHIVPDMVYRLGARPATEVDRNSTADRIPNAPTFNQGMAICLDEQQHAGLHGTLRVALNGLGAVNTPNGTAPMGDISNAAAASILAIPGLPPECKALAIAALRGQMKQKGLSPGQPGRTKESPLPSGDAAKVLRQGHY